jgi:hypothetical protein
MFHFKSKFLQKPTTATTIIPDTPTKDAAKTTTTTTNHLQSRLLLERQRREGSICGRKPAKFTLLLSRQSGAVLGGNW